MMPCFSNKTSQTLIIGVKFTPVALVAALLFAGMCGAVADDAIRPTARITKSNSAAKSDSNPPSRSTEGRMLPSTFGDGKFLASLRFWEKEKSPPQPQQSAPPSHRPTPARPQETEKGSIQAETLAPKKLSATPDAPAPVPNEPVPNNPYAERERLGFGDAPLPMDPSAHHRYESGNAFSRDAPTVTSSYLSYSFDTRDWVEHFPNYQESDPPIPENIQLATQPTSLRSTALEPAQYWNDEDRGNQWDGQAITLAARIQRSPVPFDAAPVVSTFDALESAEPPLMELSPSYQNRLPYVQTCGVVVVQANFPLTEITSILDEIKQLQYDLNRYIGVPAPKEKIELCLFRNEETYISFLREFFPRAPTDRRALYVKLDNKPGTLLVQKSKDFEIDLRHEMTHAIVHASISRVPIWLDEGLAKYFEVPAQERLGHHPYMSQLHWNTKRGSIPSLDRLTKLETIDDMGAKEYRDSWAWTHFLIHRSPETHRLLAAYLQMLAHLPQEKESSGVAASVGDKIFDWSGRAKQPPIPSLKLYLDDIMTNQRETFKEHFGMAESMVQ